MNKIYLVFITFLPAFTTLYAQPVLDASGLIRIGDIVVVQDCQPENTTPGDAGPNRIWDFSQMQSKDSTFSTHYINPVGTPYATEYPESNIGAFYFGNTYGYYHLTDTALLYYGQRDEVSYSNLTDPALFFKFPATYGLTVTDSVAGTFLFNGLNGNVTGDVLFQVDGYGSLSTPTGNYDNVLRIKTTTAVRYTIPFFGEIFDTTTNHSWYTPGYKSPLVEMIDVTSWNNGAQLNYGRSVNYYLSLVSGTEETIPSFFAIQAYPNPAVGQVRFSGIEEPSLVNIYDVQGKFIRQTTVFPDITVDISDLNTGIYICTFQDKNGKGNFVKMEVR